MNKELLTIEEASSTYQLATDNCGLRKGYKQTEVGVIPEDWVIKQIRSVCTLINGRGFKPFEWQKSGLPIIRIQNLNGSDDFNYYKGNYDKKLEVEPDQLLFAWSGSRGTSFGPHVWSGPLGLLNYHTWKVQIKEAEIDKDFFLYALKNITSYIEDKAHGASALVHTQKWEMEGFEFIAPSDIAEQRAIANALSDVDALLAKLDQLITKKRDLKQASMQQLLTGQTRLPGFSSNTKYKKTEVGLIPEDWNVKKIGDICEYQNGTSLEHLFNDREGLQVISIGNYSTSGNFIYRDTYIDIRHIKLVEKFVLKKNDLAMSLNDKTAIGAILGRVLLIREDDNFVFNQRTMRLRPKIDIIPAYLYYVINGDYIHNSLVALAKPGTQIYINTDDVIELKIPVPYAAEQQAIATFLSDMDTEITALETRRDKTRDLKQGMMQELLTGRIRLI